MKKQTKKKFGGDKNIRYSKYIYLFILFLLSSILIFYNFPKIPHHLAFDELQFARTALSLESKPYTPYTTLATGHTTLYFYIILLSLKMFGINTFALRLPSAVFGVLSVILSFLIFKRVFRSEIYGFIASFILVTQRWYYTFARFSFEVTFLLFLELTSLYFIIQFKDNKKSRYLFLAALFAGLAFHSYLPGRIFFIIPLSVLIMMKERKYILYFLSLFFVVTIPLLIYFTQHPDTRVDQLFFLTSSAMSYKQKIVEVMTNIQRSLVMYYGYGDMNGRHNYPGKASVNMGVTLLLTASIFVLTQIKRSWKHIVFLLYFILGSIPPILVLSKENPNMLRSFTVLPSIAYFTTLALRWIQQTVLKSRLVASIIIFALFLSISFVYDMRTYFKYEAEVTKHSFQVTCDLKTSLTFKVNSLGEIPKRCRT